MLGDLNERAISFEEVGEAVNEMKSAKAKGDEKCGEKESEFS